MLINTDYRCAGLTGMIYEQNLRMFINLTLGNVSAKLWCTNKGINGPAGAKHTFFKLVKPRKFFISFMLDSCWLEIYTNCSF